jgi:hypothetical protein
MTMQICPFCGQPVADSDPDRTVINNSGVVCHGYCLNRAKDNAEKKGNGHDYTAGWHNAILDNRKTS